MNDRVISCFLLDTNILLGFVREAAWAIKARADYGLGDSETMVFTSVICKGEILALAEKLGWTSSIWRESGLSSSM